jgi:hypothetical protein
MSLVFASRASDSTHVQHVGTLRAERDSVFSVVPDGSWGLVIYRRPERTDVYLTGCTTRPISVPLRAGDQILSVSFKPSTYAPALPAASLLDKAVVLPFADRKSIWWNRHQRLELPSFESADDFVAALVRRGYLEQNKAVDAVLQGDVPPMSLRTIQRHFLKTTGMTQNYWQQIQRAQKAAASLHTGKSLAEVAVESGYVDQSHMTRWLKHIIGRTPSEIARTRQP